MAKRKITTNQCAELNKLMALAIGEDYLRSEQMWALITIGKGMFWTCEYEIESLRLARRFEKAMGRRIFSMSIRRQPNHED